MAFVRRGFVLLLLGLWTAMAPLAAGSVNLSWNASPGATGYRVFSGSSSGQYGTPQTLGNTTQTTVSSMQDCQATFFAVSAFNTYGESPRSNEISSWPRPSITATAPSWGARGQTLNVVLTGNNYQLGASVQFANATVNSVSRDACGQMTASITIGSSAPLGPIQITVTQPNGVAGTASGLFTIQTAPDTTAPSVSLTAPAAGATVSGSVTVSATASDNVGVFGVQFLLNGSALGAEDTTAPYQITWDTTTVPNASYTLSARARDAAGNITTVNRTVTVSNVPLPDVQNLRRTDK